MSKWQRADQEEWGPRVWRRPAPRYRRMQQARGDPSVPARLASTRLPGKPLAMIGDKTLMQHVYDSALTSGAERVVIATDDDRIEDAARSIGAGVIMTSAEHRSGTDRIREAAERDDRVWGPLTGRAFDTLIAAADCVAGTDRLRTMTWTLVICSIPLAATGVFNYFSGEYLSTGVRGFYRIAGYTGGSGLAGNPNDLALMLNLIIPLVDRVGARARALAGA